MSSSNLSRRRFLQTSSLAVSAAAAGRFAPAAWAADAAASAPLEQFGYGDVQLSSDPHEEQLRNTHAVLMEMNEDSLLRPFRQMAGQPAPGEDLGGWYNYVADFDYHHGDVGFAPACTFGQWVSALARSYAITGDQATRDKIVRLNRLYAQTISARFYQLNRFPAYAYDKLLLGLIDSHTLAGDPQALAILEQTTNTAVPQLPGHAVEHGTPWRTDPDKQDVSWTWDESYTMPENLFLAYQRGAGKRYYDMALAYLDDKPWFDPLSRNEDVLNGRHAYSHVNSLSSAAMAYLVAGSEKHLRAARNGFAMIEAQSFATGGWGPDETLRAPGSNDVFASLTNTHSSFETPCGSYGHFKITRYLLRITRDAHYGDSMERVMLNTVLGAKTLETDGHTFYYSDYNFDAHRVYHVARWPCCSGTLPQVAADYRINTYLRGRQAVYVNLYIPSTLRWKENGAALSLTQDGEYPYEPNVTFTVTSSAPADLTLHFRIPAWAEGASIAVNGRRQDAVPGQFAPVRRTWKTGDRVELELPLKMRLEAIDARHPETVALLRGPLVLMAVKPRLDSSQPPVTRAQLLAAERSSGREWQAQSSGAPMTLAPFSWLGDRPYTTYLKVS